MAKIWRGAVFTASQRAAPIQVLGNEKVTGRYYWFKTTPADFIVEVVDKFTVDAGNRPIPTSDPTLNASAIVGEVWHGDPVTFGEMDIVSINPSFKEAAYLRPWVGTAITGTLYLEVTD